MRLRENGSESNLPREILRAPSAQVSREDARFRHDAGCAGLMLFDQGAMVGSKSRRQRGPLTQVREAGVDLLAILTP